MPTKIVNCFRGAKCVASFEIEIRGAVVGDDDFTREAKKRMAAAGLGSPPFADVQFVARNRYVGLGDRTLAQNRARDGSGNARGS